MEITLGIDEVKPLRGDKTIGHIEFPCVCRRKEICENGQDNEQNDHQPTRNRRSTFSETTPDQLKIALVLLSAGCGRSGVGLLGVLIH